MIFTEISFSTLNASNCFYKTIAKVIDIPREEATMLLSPLAASMFRKVTPSTPSMCL